MFKNYLNGTHQQSRARGDQVRNHAGGYVFEVSKFKIAERFFMIGAEGGTLYLGENKLTFENLSNVRHLAKNSPKELAKLMSDIRYKVIKNDYLIAGLAILWTTGTKDARDAAEEIFYDIVRIPTHLFTFFDFIKRIDGKVVVGSKLRKLISKFYSKDVEDLAYHITKYQNRAGFSHLDVLRLVHTKPATDYHNQLFGWLAGKKDAPKIQLVQDFLKLREAKNVKEVIGIINNNKSITWEMIPSEFLSSADVWGALLPNLPATALIRNLGRLSALGLLQHLSDNAKFVAEKISSKEFAVKSKIHPLNAVIAQRTYKLGRGIKGSLSWQVNNAILEALEVFIWNTFDALEPTGKRYLVGLDVSASMFWDKSIKGVLTPGEAAGIMALAFVKAEGAQNVHTMAFTNKFLELDLTKYTTIDALFYRLNNMPFGSTDCALPIVYANKSNLSVDVFITLTDNETWYGQIHPFEALKKYRNNFISDAKNIVCAFEPTNFSIADPNDIYSLDISGFDPSLPKIIQEFAKFK